MSSYADLDVRLSELSEFMSNRRSSLSASSSESFQLDDNFNEVRKPFHPKHNSNALKVSLRSLKRVSGLQVGSDKLSDLFASAEIELHSLLSRVSFQNGFCNLKHFFDCVESSDENGSFLIALKPLTANDLIFEELSGSISAGVAEFKDVAVLSSRFESCMLVLVSGGDGFERKDLMQVLDAARLSVMVESIEDQKLSCIVMPLSTVSRLDANELFSLSVSSLNPSAKLELFWPLFFKIESGSWGDGCVVLQSLPHSSFLSPYSIDSEMRLNVSKLHDTFSHVKFRSLCSGQLSNSDFEKLLSVYYAIGSVLAVDSSKVFSEQFLSFFLESSIADGVEMSGLYLSLSFNSINEKGSRIVFDESKLLETFFETGFKIARKLQGHAFKVGEFGMLFSLPKTAVTQKAFRYFQSSFLNKLSAKTNCKSDCFELSFAPISSADFKSCNSIESFSQLLKQKSASDFLGIKRLNSFDEAFFYNLSLSSSIAPRDLCELFSSGVEG